MRLSFFIWLPAITPFLSRRRSFLHLVMQFARFRHHTPNRKIITLL